ncbi:MULTISPECIES: copper resistance system multicopper oxidase [unclassified Sphingomonas]|uniref:copper resistance system multicopper oxidase n=1 Tax=unclassified Sphingomonas TaxID=196159 RepID=UPI0006FDE2A2|nr:MULTISPECIES: copper resistance system multicopper oxidase [unclassified Sphingomonas]KQX24137.1 copper-binding protein [Sphingomonas sp. Root1294]KQY69689.1 copper-binding protein [Sphingomonas sp. Root50]KRB93437.1 copper-binding protein [Sphingomonas sp. Root720]
MRSSNLDRRALLRGAAIGGAGLGLASWFPAWAQPVSAGIARPLPMVGGSDIALRIAHQMMTIDGRESHAIGINGTVPAPLIRLKQGTTVRLSVTNDLDEDSSIHWHGLLVPAQFDGVPGISFPGIRPRSTFVYEFPIIQSGTYWYHSHSGLQEQMGHYGPIVIDPEGEDPVRYDREHVIVLSDHSSMHPHAIFLKLKQQAGYFNYQKQTLAGLLAGRDQSLKERMDWGKMRMDPTDISDVTGSTYAFLVNGHGPSDNWTALFRPGERVRLRFVNASAMTIFNVRIPGLPLTIVQADGQDVRPVTVDEFQITIAETFDVIVTPTDERAYTIVGEAVDRSGLARATLAPREGMAAEVPPLRSRPVATMKDMGMDMSGMDMGASGGTIDLSKPDGGMAGMDHAAMGHDMAAGAAGAMAGMAPAPQARAEMAGMDHSAMGGMSMNMRDPKNAPQVRMGPGVQTIAPMAMDRTGEPGQGLENVGHKVLVYRDLMALARNPDVRAPDRAMEIHLTANMERYMWSFDGRKMSEVKAPIPFLKDERVRVTLVNDTMMSHPIHLHGHFFELVTGHGEYAPRKHTVNVLPGGKVTFDVTTDAVGDWAFHCHMLYHMHAGMMQVVSVRPRGDAA